jgi:hypothetical protein
LNTELELIINSEDGKRKELTATEKIAKDAEESIGQLRLEKKAADILREKEKNLELVTAEQNKNNLLEVEAARYNDALTQLGLERDAALAESFDYLKQLMKNGYDEIIAKAQEALDAGKITASEYDEIINKWNALKNLIGEVKSEGLPTIPNFDFDWDFTVPRFESGGFVQNAGVVSGSRHGAGYGDAGISMIDRRSGREVGEMEGGEPVMVLSRNTYANNKAVIDQLMHSSLYRSGAPIMMQNGGFLPVSMTGSYEKGMFERGGTVSSTKESYQVPERKSDNGMGSEYVKLMLSSLLEQTEYLKQIADKETPDILHDIEKMNRNLQRARI